MVIVFLSGVILDPKDIK